MGICSSFEATSVATVKLILQDGELREFSYPVRVSHVLQTNPACFVCNSDDMDFDDFVSAMNGEEQLQLGQLYFVLPKNWLARRVQAAEMASLAIKASSALSRSGGEKMRGCRRVEALEPVPLLAFSEVRGVVAGGRSSTAAEKGKRKGAGGGGGRRFVAKLSSVPEE